MRRLNPVDRLRVLVVFGLSKREKRRIVAAFIIISTTAMFIHIMAVAYGAMKP